MSRPYDRLIALVIALGVLIAVAVSAHAESFEDAITRFAADSYDDTDAAISGVATSGNPLAAEVIAALQDRRLLFSPESHKVFIKDASGRLLDAATGRPVAGDGPADLTQVRVNNRLRRAVDVRDPYHPKEIGYFIPAITEATDKRCVKVDGKDRCKVAIQTNNVETDDRGYVYIVDRANTGMHILELTPEAKRAAGIQ